MWFLFVHFYIIRMWLMDYADFLHIGYMKNKLKMNYCVLAYGGHSIYLTCDAMLKHGLRCHPESVCQSGCHVLTFLYCIQTSLLTR